MQDLTRARAEETVSGKTSGLFCLFVLLFFVVPLCFLIPIVSFFCHGFSPPSLSAKLKAWSNSIKLCECEILIKNEDLQTVRAQKKWCKSVLKLMGQCVSIMGASVGLPLTQDWRTLVSTKCDSEV